MQRTTNTPAAVAPIKRQRRSCSELGICQGLATPCADCTPFETQGCADQNKSGNQPAELWDLIWFYGVVALAALCTFAVVCGIAGWIYATTPNFAHIDIKTMPEQIKPIAAIEAEAKRAALLYSDINYACPYPFGTDAAHHFKAAFNAERQVIEAMKARKERTAA